MNNKIYNRQTGDSGDTLFLLGWENGFSAVCVDYDDIMNQFRHCFDLYDFDDYCGHVERMVFQLRQKIKSYSSESKSFTVAAFCPTGCHIVTMQKDDMARSVFFLMEQLCRGDHSIALQPNYLL